MRLSEIAYAFHALLTPICVALALALYGCSSDTQPAAPTTTFVYTAAPLMSCEPVACTPVPCEAPKKSGPPPHVTGLATVRFGVMHSKEEAERKLRDLEELISRAGWSIEVWKTKSGKDTKVTHRLQASKVDPAAAAAMCKWLATKGWEPGVVPCELRAGIALP